VRGERIGEEARGDWGAEIGRCQRERERETSALYFLLARAGPVAKRICDRPGRICDSWSRNATCDFEPDRSQVAFATGPLRR
jgi:hypothetical protein